MVVMISVLTVGLLTLTPQLNGAAYNQAISEADTYSRIAESHMWSLGQQSGQANICHALSDAVTNWLLATQGYEKAFTTPPSPQDTDRMSDEVMMEKIKTEKAKAENAHTYFEQSCR